MKDKRQQLEPDMEQLIGSKLGKVYIKAVYCHPAYLICMKCTSCEMEDWISTSWNQDCWENLRYTDDTTLIAESEERKSLLMNMNEQSEKAGLKLNIQKTKITASSPITSWQTEGEKWK